MTIKPLLVTKRIDCALSLSKGLTPFLPRSADNFNIMAEKEFTATEVMMLQERLEKGITVIGEQVSGLSDRMGKVEGRLDTLDEKMDIVLASIPNKVNKSEFNQLERRVEVLEAKPA